MDSESPIGQPEPPITLDDEWSDDPQRQKAFWIHSAGGQIDTYLGLLSAPLASLGDRTARAFQEGHEWELTFDVKNIPPSHRDEAKEVIGEVRALIYEKGFRFASALLTPREHKKIGSSGFGGMYWEADPDVPVPLLRDRLIAAGKITEEYEYDSELYTFEEVDRARRLMGMTTLDQETHRVTDQIDEAASADSYLFLTPDRRAEVMLREAELLDSIATLASLALVEHEGTRRVVNDLERYAEGKITTPELEEILGPIYDRVPEDTPFNLGECISNLRMHAVSQGYWDHIFTPQEIMMRVGGIVDEKYLAQPYTPLGIQDGMPVEDVIGLREGEKAFIFNASIYEYGMPFGIRLESLTPDGTTVKSPTLLDRWDGKSEIETEEFKAYFEGRLTVPFAREGDWYYHAS